jgi:hypothetical protein
MICNVTYILWGFGDNFAHFHSVNCRPSLFFACSWNFGSDLIGLLYCYLLSFTDIGNNEHQPKKLQQPMVCHSVDGVYRVEGETWPLDACTRCLCHLGRVLCETHHCPPAPCPKPVYQAGQCCPLCADSTPVSGSGHSKSCSAHRPHGTAWLEDSCRSCICLDGQVSCFTQQCPDIICSRPVLAKNQCCPICLGKHLFWFLWAIF